ncbi:hypothetical protein XENOCAPTIV_020779, partial [Xenoophorus captivus]
PHFSPLITAAPQLQLSLTGWRNSGDMHCLHQRKDPDSVSFCVLATDELFECDIALQIHFTLIQSFCFDNDISIVRVSDMQRLADIVGDETEQLEDAHCVLITVTSEQTRSRGATRGWLSSSKNILFLMNIIQDR